MKAIKNMLLGLLIILFGFGVGLIPFPFSSNILPNSAEMYRWITWIIILVGVVVALIGYFRGD